MLLSMNDLSSYTIEASDGSIGQVHGFLFDDLRWVLRYMTVDTRVWLPGRKVLIPPPKLGRPDVLSKAFPVDLTREQVKNSPDIDTEKPVSRQHEIELYQYYSWYPYWNAGLEPIITPYYGFEQPVIPGKTIPEQKSDDSDPHLRSSREVIGYKIHAVDGNIGHVDDFLVDDENWRIRYMTIDTRNWLPGRKVIIPPDWIKKVSWEDSEIIVDVNKEDVENSPEFDQTLPVSREYETNLYNHYDRAMHWM